MPMCSSIMYVNRNHGGQTWLQRTCMLNLLQDIQSDCDKLPQNVSNLPILILRHTGCNDIYQGCIQDSELGRAN